MTWAQNFCSYCGGSIRPGDPGQIWDWPRYPTGVWLHPRCEAMWYDGHKVAGEMVKRSEWKPNRGGRDG